MDEWTRHCLANSTMLIQAEDELNLPSHTLYGAILCDQWMFAESVKQACTCHELRDLKAFNLGEREGSNDFIVVCISNVLSNLALHELSDDLRHESRAETQKALDCNEDEFVIIKP
jgi:hypothetical protein